MASFTLTTTHVQAFSTAAGCPSCHRPFSSATDEFKKQGFHSVGYCVMLPYSPATLRVTLAVGCHACNKHVYVDYAMSQLAAVDSPEQCVKLLETEIVKAWSKAGPEEPLRVRLREADW